MFLAAALATIALLALAGYWIWLRQTQASDVSARTARPKRFGAVEIRLRGAACDAAKKLEGERFLAGDAPELPLRGCSANQCGCSFVKLADRRTDDRRLQYVASFASSLVKADQRKRSDR